LTKGRHLTHSGRVVTLLGRVLSFVNRLLAPARVELVSRSELGAIRAATELPDEASGSNELAAEADRYLVPDNPRLIELTRRYAGHPAASPSRWTKEFVERQVYLRRFRDDNAFVWSRRDAYVYDGARKVRRATRAINYVLSAYYVRTVDALGVLERSVEDESFGNRLVPVDAQLSVSRDLLDSALELNFLERHLEVSGQPSFQILDIGGGYGRLAHRAAETFPNARVLCTDAVPEATFIAEYYLGFREVDEHATALPLDELGSVSPGQLDLATNVHSWSECPLGAISWWLDFLADREVPQLMIVPNDGEHLLSLEEDGERLDFAPLLTEHGYALAAREPKFGETSCQRFGVYPTHYHLFIRS
jgi:putative sugar O-methyltransferase